MGEGRLRFGVNAVEVVHETIDGEVIVIHLASGNYYSLSGCGPVIWDALLQGGTTRAEIVTLLGARYDASTAEIDGAVQRLLDELCREDLVIDVGDLEHADSPPVRTVGEAAVREPFEPPTLGKYTDMQDLVRLDPVHEVDATGWPQPRAAADAVDRAG